ncbi:hypothetical protein AK830_g10154 [Neonectria ditissima]|uniref:Uncharacterized protein n=1 Tax=Neonectria ditissima TaxID=78410 RepID=A0A0P7B7F0_9HYPO|nr:hypothetical protein AK830_g10154 [Neonectria ditissima]
MDVEHLLESVLDHWVDSMDEDDPTRDVTEVTEIIDTSTLGANSSPSVLADQIVDARNSSAWAMDDPATDTALNTRADVSISRWVGSDFNTPSGFEEENPPRLMDSSAIDLERTSELYRLHTIGFNMNNGDTLVFIDFPSPCKASRNKADCNGIAYKSQEFRVHSENLLKTNSSKFTEMLSPTYQFRVLRRRKLVNKLPADVKYVLDLTPPSEGDELVFQMTELSLTPGIIKWWSSSMLHRVDSYLVCGHDDICVCDRLKHSSYKPEVPQQQGSLTVDTSDNEATISDDKQKPGLATRLPLTPDRILQMKARHENEVYPTPDYRRIPDYCPYRHRNGIIRLLMMIEHNTVTFDSAPRVWTLVKLSQIFDCCDVVRDPAAQWIMHGPNVRFIEVLPEEALQIAFALKLPAVAQCAFRILVNELALMEVDDNIKDVKSIQLTTFGRKRGDLPDELSNIVQHAARAFVERISDKVAIIQNADMFDYWNIPEWNRLRTIEQLLTQQRGPASDKALDSLRALMSSLVNKITDTFDLSNLRTLSANFGAHHSIDLDRATYVEPKDYEELPFIMKKLNPTQMLLCSMAYNEAGSSLESRLYVEGRYKLPGKPALQYSRYVRNATDALQRVFDENVMLVYDVAWKPCFDPTVPTRLNGNGVRVVRSPLVDLHNLETDVKDKLRPITLSWIRHDINPPLNITRHLLLTLTPDEMKFLPLWAGGCDDGTGGVFETQIPPAIMGPNGPGPSYHTGMTLPSLTSSSTGSMIDDLADMRLRGSTTCGSIDVHDSISTVYRPDRVIVDDESIMSEAFTSEGTEYQAAKYEVPADHQSIGSAVAMLVDDPEAELQAMVADRESTPGAADDDMNFWNEETDSDDSVAMVEEEHTRA